MIGKFVRDSIIYGFASLLSRGLSFLLVPYYSHSLVRSQFGMLDISTTFVIIATCLIAAEISQGMARAYGDEKSPDERFSYLLSSLLYITLAYFAVGVLLYVFKEKCADLLLGDVSQINLVVCAYVCSFFTAVQVQISNHFRWSLQTKKAAIYTVVQTVSCLLFTILYVSFFQWGAVGAVLGVASGLVLLIMIELFDLRRIFCVKISFTKIKHMLVFSLPLVPSGVGIFATQFANRFVVKDLMHVGDVADLGVASRIAAIVGLAMMGIGSALMPLVTEHHQEKETPQKIAQIFSKVCGLSLIAVAILSIFRREFVLVFSTPEYAAASSLLGFFAASTILSQLYPFSPGFWLKKKVGIMVMINLSTAVLGVALNYLLIPRLGLIAVGYSSLLSALVMVIVSMYFSNRLYPIPYGAKAILLGVVGVASFVCLDSFLMRIDLFHSLSFAIFAKVFSVCCVIASVMIAGILPSSEVIVFLSVVKKRVFASRA